MRFRSALIIFVGLLLLDGCGRGQVATPWTGYRGDPRSQPGAITSGSAFGVSIGMSHEEAVIALQARNHLHRSAAFCLGPSASDSSKLEGDVTGGWVDYEKTNHPPDLECKHTLQEIWASGASIYGVPIFAEVEIIEVNFKDRRANKIQWHGGGNIIG
jgi:hypothetical protein